MEVYQIEPKDFTTSQWAGGTTTQLFIHPPTATYAHRNFDFRLSSARVCSEFSTFTSLPGISRKLMILEGQIQIDHKYHHSKNLKKFEQDAFQGDWITTCKGTCVDFNLMTCDKRKTEINHLTIKKNMSIHVTTQFASWAFIYVATGKVIIETTEKNCIVPQNHLSVIQNAGMDSLSIIGSDNSDLVMVLIQ